MLHNGTATQPPHWGYCGVHPGNGWLLNSSGTTHFYHIIIPHPDTSASITAPFIQYNIALNGSEVFGTFGKGYTIYKRALRPTPVGYNAPPLTPEQLHIFDVKEPFAYAVDKVINEYFPYELSAAVRQYQFYKNTQYTLQQTIRTAQQKEWKYLEKAMEVLSELENANVLGHLLAHTDQLAEALAPNLDANAQYIKAIKGFAGDITESALDPHINRYRSTVEEQGEPIPDYILDEEYAKKQRILDDRKATIRRRCEKQQTTHAAVFPVHTRKQCFRCGHYGHICAHCPRRSPPSGRK